MSSGAKRCGGALRHGTQRTAHSAQRTTPLRYGAAVPQGFERFNTCFNDLAAGLAVNCRDQADTAGILTAGIEPRLVFQAPGVVFVAFNECGSLCCR